MQHSDEKIERTAKILDNAWGLFLLSLKETWSEMREFSITMKRNFIGQRNTKKIATVIFGSIILIPALLSYCGWIGSIWNYLENIILFDQHVKVLQTESENSVRNFFKTYNDKYGVDCDWIKKVNVDMNMDRLGTDKKPGQFCSLTQKVQFFPITVENPISNGSQYSRINGKAIYVIFEGSEIKNAWYQKYELWRKMEWPITDWKFNPFPQDGKIRLK